MYLIIDALLVNASAAVLMVIFRSSMKGPLLGM
jgi:hypothetical protein